MTNPINAIYENGVFRPLEPLTLPEREHVKITVSRGEHDDWMDTEFMDSCADGADPTVRLEDVRQALSKIRGSMSQVVSDDRGEY